MSPLIDGEWVRGPSHVVLVAIHVDASCHPDVEMSRHQAMDIVSSMISRDEYEGPAELSWWIAEDDRNDGSDCDSALFCNPGGQAQASRVLHDTIARDPHTGLMSDPPVPLTGLFNLVVREVRGQFDGGPV